MVAPNAPLIVFVATLPDFPKFFSEVTPVCIQSNFTSTGASFRATHRATLVTIDRSSWLNSLLAEYRENNFLIGCAWRGVAVAQAWHHLFRRCHASDASRFISLATPAIPITYGPEVLSPVCAPGARYFSTILWAYKGALNAFGVVMAAKTWNCADGVGEVRFLSRDRWLCLFRWPHIFRWRCL